ncbi:MAG TPA: hypothetical protein VG694_01770 [Candidatus Paceibacterota bacterium]|jgi:DNA polymerase III delta subunit|nr:hypothetical protein [Candidatus Paceibacterota bacterium]
MIHFLYGEDRGARNSALEKILDSLPEGTEIFRLDKETFDPDSFENFFSSSGLFFKKCTVVLSEVLASERNESFVSGKLDLIKDSANVFVFLEDAPAKATLAAFEESGAKIAEFAKVKEKKERFNSFVLANALGSRDRLGLWLGFRQAMMHGAALDELAGVLFWKAKDMILRGNFRLFSKDELVNISGRMASLLPEARRRGEDDEASFERFILEAF